MSRSQIKAVIFDMDGLVLDTETGYRQAWQQAAEALGFSLSDDTMHALTGLEGREVIQQLQYHCGNGFDAEAFKSISAEFWNLLVQEQGIPLKKGFQKLLTRLKHWQLPFCLATNSSKANALHCLEIAGLGGVFPVIIAGDEVDNPKPAADLFRRAAQLLEFPVEHCLVLEDTPVGIAAAVAAHAPHIYVPSFGDLEGMVAVSALAVHTNLEQTAEYLETMLGDRYRVFI